MRRPGPGRAKKRPSIKPLLIPIIAGFAVLALVAVTLVLLTRGDDSADPGTGLSPSPSATPSSSTSYSPPANALPVAQGVYVVPVEGWSPLEKETQGKQLVNYAPNNEPRAFFWVRQKQNVTANAFALGIVEGETDKEIAQLGTVRNLDCPKDVLVECVAISYSSTSSGVNVQGWVEAYRRQDGLVTALDFRTRTDYAQKAEADAVPMKQSVLDSL